MNIWIHRQGENYGPYTRETVSLYLEHGSLTPRDWAWVPGTKSWERLEDLLDDPLDINDRSSSSKITLQVAESYLSDPASVPLEEYDSIDSEAAEYLASKNVELDLSGLHSLDDASAKYFSGLWPNFVSLSNRLTLSTEAKQELANGLVGCDSVSYLELSLLKGIKRLDLSGCEHLQELIGLGLLTELQELSLAGCVRLEQLSLENLSSLKVLRLDNCISLKEVDLSSCSDIQEFYFSNCNAPSVFGFSSLKGLKVLNLSGYSKTAFNLTWFDQLERLQLADCSSIRALYFAKLYNLRHLDVSGCEKLETADISSCSKLKRFIAGRCTSLRSVEGLQDHLKLQQISVRGCTRLQHLNLSGCSALEELDAGACESLETLLIENAVSLKVLNLGEMDALCSWSGLSPFDQLTELLNSDYTPRSLDDFKNNIQTPTCSRLKRLNLNACNQLKKVIIAGCSGLEEILGLEELNNLVELDSSDASLGAKIDLSSLVSLEKLSLDGVECPQGISGLDQLSNLRNLILPLQSALQIPSLPCLKFLKLTIDEDQSLMDVGDLSSLETLLVLNAGKALNLDLLKELSHLKILVLVGEYLGEFEDLAAMKRLEKIWVTDSAAGSLSKESVLSVSGLEAVEVRTF